jgi:hypothetical protein
MNRKSDLVFVLKAVLATGVGIGLGTILLRPGPKISKPILKQISSNEAKVYYVGEVQDVKGVQTIYPGYTYVYVDEKPYGSLDYVLTLQPRGQINRVVRGDNPTQEDIDNFKRITEQNVEL